MLISADSGVPELGRASFVNGMRRLGICAQEVPGQLGVFEHDVVLRFVMSARGAHGRAKHSPEHSRNGTKRVAGDSCGTNVPAPRADGSELHRGVDRRPRRHGGNRAGAKTRVSGVFGRRLSVLPMRATRACFRKGGTRATSPDRRALAPAAMLAACRQDADQGFGPAPSGGEVAGGEVSRATASTASLRPFNRAPLRSGEARAIGSCGHAPTMVASFRTGDVPGGARDRQVTKMQESQRSPEFFCPVAS